MRICGRHIALLAVATLTLAACGGGSGEAGAGGGNLPPVIQGTPATTLTAGTPYSFTPQAADPNGDAITFSATNVPTWAKFNTTTGALTGTPTEANVGKSGMITIEVSDSKSIAELPAFQIEVVSAANVPPPTTNTPPTIQGTPATGATVGQLYTFTPVGNDANGDTLAYTIDNKPSWATFTSATGELRGTPTSTDVGTTSNIVITVTDGFASTSLPAFSLTVNSVAPPANRPPTISGTPAATATVGTAYSFRPVGSDPDGNTLVYSIQNMPTWATFSTSTGRLAGTPTSADVGTSARITISVSDSIAAAVSLPSFTIQVSAPANRAPTISGTPATSVAVGAAYSFQPSASDADGNTLTFTIANKPTWATFSTSTGLLSGTPSSGDVGSTTGIVISVSDGTAITALASFGISVVGTTTGSATVSWTAPLANTDGTTLTNLAGFRVAYGKSSTNLDQSAAVTNPSVSTYTVDNLTSGTWYFAVYAVNAAGVESDTSNVASKTIP